MVKKIFDYKKFLIFGGIPTALVSILGFMVVSSKTITVYAELPKQVEETKQEVGDIKDYVKQQRMQNELMQKIVSQHDEPKISDDGKTFYNEDEKEWQPIKRLKKYMEDRK